jgi:biotin carboxyl carrier protein
MVTRVMAQAEKAVNVGEPLLILEAMKMGNEIRAPRSGVVKQIHVQPGKTVLLGEVMVEIA